MAYVCYQIMYGKINVKVYNVEMSKVIMECMNHRQLNIAQRNNYVSEIEPTWE